ncbi:MAG: prepilin-type N-terminal cleavage/methylation domain-containing protein [Candidatus Omnitrophota bacterium]
MRTEKGFSLMEVMVALAITTFIIASAYAIVNTARRSWLVGEAQLLVQQEARLGIDKMAKELKLAGFATVGSDYRTVRFKFPIDADADGNLDLINGTKMLVYGADGVSGWYVEYQIDPDPPDPDKPRILRQILDDSLAPQGQPILLVNYINSTPALTYFSTESGGTGGTNSGVNITLTTEIASFQGVSFNPPISMRLTSGTVSLRN